MAVSIRTIYENGGIDFRVDIECHATNGLPAILIVGLAGKSLDESKERLRASFNFLKIPFPRKRITVNLAPADLQKEGSSFDLPIAVAIMANAGNITTPPSELIFIGELGLDGSIRPVRGIIGKLLAAKKHGFNKFCIPKANLEQAQLVPGIELWTISNLMELFKQFASQSINQPKFLKTGAGKLNKDEVYDDRYIVDFKEIVGQKRAKRALLIAAAGNHNVLMNGPPGVGKSMLAKALPGILPKPTLDEILIISHLHSLVTSEFEKIITYRPFRSPHHSSSDISILGGGQKPRPGEVSLAHGGVLLLDEFPEFHRSTLEALRQPLEDKQITIARAKGAITFPANFALIATRNPCPCGFYGTNKTCNCTQHQIENYEKKISGPIIDRIDLHVQVDDVPHKKLLDDTNEELSSEHLRFMVMQARKLQSQRFAHPSMLNGDMNNRQIKSLANLSEDGKNLLNDAAASLQLSARVYMRTIKLSRTIADLDKSETINKEHVAEALQYRPATSQ